MEFVHFSHPDSFQQSPLKHPDPVPRPGNLPPMPMMMPIVDNTPHMPSFQDASMGAFHSTTFASTSHF
jgi:hypothetical protein